MKNFTALCAIVVLTLASCTYVPSTSKTASDSTKSVVTHVDSSIVTVNSVTVTDSSKHK